MKLPLGWPCLGSPPPPPSFRQRRRRQRLVDRHFYVDVVRVVIVSVIVVDVVSISISIGIVYVCLVCALIVAVLVLRLPNQLIDSLEQCACADAVAADSNRRHSGMQLEFLCTV